MNSDNSGSLDAAGDCRNGRALSNASPVFPFVHVSCRVPLCAMCE